MWSATKRARKRSAPGLNYADDLCIRTEHERLFKNMVQG